MLLNFFALSSGAGMSGKAPFVASSSPVAAAAKQPAQPRKAQAPKPPEPEAPPPDSPGSESATAAASAEGGQADPLLDRGQPSAAHKPVQSQEARQILTGVYLTFCGCWICVGNTLGETFQDCASCARALRKSFSNPVAFYIFAVVFWALATCVFFGSSVWSSAYYNKHYAPEYRQLKLNATSKALNGTALHDAKERLAEWRSNPLWDYFPMQKRYYIPGVFIFLAIVFAGVQTFVRPNFDKDKWGLHTKEDEDSCSCCAYAMVLGARVCALISWVLGGSIAMGYLIMAVTFVDTLEEHKHAMVPVLGTVCQCFLLTMSFVCVLIGKWLAYREAMRHTRDGMDPDEFGEKIM